MPVSLLDVMTELDLKVCGMKKLSFLLQQIIAFFRTLDG